MTQIDFRFPPEERYFNPHEREARDVKVLILIPLHAILIHTSVKLVTALCPVHTRHEAILIHTSVKLVTNVIVDPFFSLIF